jgi:hypothetical protein
MNRKRSTSSLFQLLLACCCAVITNVPAAAADSNAQKMIAEKSQEIPLDDCVLLRHGQDQAKMGPRVHAPFRQERTIQGFTRPIVSSGEFILNFGKDIRWITREPAPSEVRIAEDGFEISSGEGEEQSKEEFRSLQFRELSKLLFAIHSAGWNSGDSKNSAQAEDPLKLLQEKFELHCYRRPEPAQYLVTAVPQDRQIAGIIKRITLQGNVFPSLVRVEDGRGDETLIHMGEFAAAAEGRTP